MEVDNSTPVQTMKVAAQENETLADVERIENYGLTSYPPKDGSEIVLGAFSGNKDDVVALSVGNSKNRPTDLEEGDVRLWDTHGNQITLSASGIAVKAADGKKVTIEGNTVEANGNSKSFVTFTELDTALQQMVAMINSHTHITTATVGPTPTPGVIAPPTIPVQLNIAAAQTATVKTGG